MNCSTCGSRLPWRPAARVIMTGLLMIGVGLVLLLFVHLAVVVLASVLMAVTGSIFVRTGVSVRASRCRNCGAQQRR